MTWLTVGADSFLAQAFIARLAAERISAVGTTRRPSRVSATTAFLDLVSPLATPLAAPFADLRITDNVSVAFLFAGITKVAACEADPRHTRIVNVDRLGELALCLKRRGCHVVMLSTNMVFDGDIPNRRADDPTNGPSEYGKQKAELEAFLVENAVSHCIVRMTKVWPSRPQVLQQWSEELNAGRIIEPFEDLSISPVPLSCAVETLLAIGRKRTCGIVQLSADCDVTYLDCARILGQAMGTPAAFIRPVKARLPASCVPRFTHLDTFRLESELGIATPHAWDVVRSAVASIQSKGAS